MDITQFAKMFPQKMAEVRKYVEGEGEGVKIDMGRIALDHFDENFEKGASWIVSSTLGKRWSVASPIHRGLVTQGRRARKAPSV